MNRSNGRYLTGLVIIAVGIAALLNNFEITKISIGYMVNLLWPVLLGVVGINFIINRQGASGIIIGGILIGMGVLFLGRNTGIFNFAMDYFWRGFWPVIIILIGISLLDKNRPDNSGNLAIMGSVEKNHEGWELESGEYAAIMGSIELDIGKASFSESEVSLILTAVMGGITLIVPDEVMVNCQGTSILGGIDVLGKGSGGIIGNTKVQSGNRESSAQILQLNCTAIMGGIEIKR